MPNTTKKISIVGVPNSTKDIGAEAQNVDVSYDANGKVILDINAVGVDVDHTKTAAEVFKDTATALENIPPKNHASTTTEYGVATSDAFGHIKPGIGLNITDGILSVKYGATADSACSGTDSRLTNDRKNPNPVVFPGDSDTPAIEYYGDITRTINYHNVGAAPVSHSDPSTKYGIATKDQYGHVRLGEGLENKNNFLTLSNASKTTIGGVKVDDETVTIDSNGVLHCEKGSTIKIHTDEVDLYGKEVTIRTADGSFTVSTNFNENGDATITSFSETGSVIVTSTNSEKQLTATDTFYIPYFGNYFFDLRFWTAEIIVSTSTPELDQLTVNVYKRVTIGSGRELKGSITFQNMTATYLAHEIGIYEFECIIDNKPFDSPQVTVEFEQEYRTSINGYISTVNITTEETDFYNKLITVDCDTRSSGKYQRTVLFDNTGIAVFRAYDLGDYIFSVEDAGGTKYKAYLFITEEIPVSHNIELSKFKVNVNISTDDYANSRCYISLVRNDGSEKLLDEYVDFNSAGNATYEATAKGTYKFSVG